MMLSLETAWVLGAERWRRLAVAVERRHMNGDTCPSECGGTFAAASQRPSRGAGRGPRPG
jgi:hypothetical protein